MTSYKRTHTCGELTKKNVKENVQLSGWVHRRRDHGGLIFIDLRDRYGLTQLVFDPEISLPSHKIAEALRNEFVISIKGAVRLRGENLTNHKLFTGEIEIQVDEIFLLSSSLTPLFPINEETITAGEETRLKYRFLDLRREELAKKFIVKHEIMQSTRNFLSNNGFIEVSTPILAKTTPEGARDYLVPSRIYPGNFYALPQSPQIYKQLLMIAGMDRYFQIAPCFRDEDLRADRQPEFTQIDLEMSFCEIDDLFPLMEELMVTVFEKTVGKKIKIPFQKMTYQKAMDIYGTDKPDLRFGMPLVNITNIIQKSSFSILQKVISENGICKALCFPKGAALSRREIDQLIAFVAPFGLNGLAWMKHTEEGLTSNISKFFSSELLQELSTQMDSKKGDLLLIAAAESSIVNQSMDHLRRHIAKNWKMIPEDAFAFSWITDFPLFRWDDKEHKIASEAHPFTSPNLEDLSLLDKDPLQVRSYAYDLVINGYELASGSQRIFDSNLQKKIFQILQLSEEEITSKFGFFVNALQYGTPPHLGIAFGLERLTMILTKTSNIRDVIAFPKTQNASDLFSQSPSPADPSLLSELHLQIKEEKNPWEVK